jgi:hypothetical protein
VNTFQLKWITEADAPISHLLGKDAYFGWAPRLLQGAAVLGTGALMVYETKKDAANAWLVLIGIVVVRLLIDPLGFSIYYWLPVETLALVGSVALIAGLRSLVARLSVGIAAYLVFIPPLIPPLLLMLLLLVLVLVTLGPLGSWLRPPEPAAV